MKTPKLTKTDRDKLIGWRAKRPQVGSAKVTGPRADRPTFQEIGRRGDDSLVRVLGEAQWERTAEDVLRIKKYVVRVQWTQHGRRRTADHADSPEGLLEALTFAEELHKQRLPQQGGSTFAEVWTKYQESDDFRDLTERSRSIFQDAWRSIGEVLNLHQRITRVERKDLKKAVAARLRTPGARGKRLGAGTVKMYFRVFRSVLAQALELGLCQEGPVHAWSPRASNKKKHKVENPVQEPEAYTTEELDRMEATLDPARLSDRFFLGALRLARSHGPRVEELCHLRWENCKSDQIIWPAMYRKTGEEHKQPLTPTARQALELMRSWHAALGIRSEWVFPSPGVKFRLADGTVTTPYRKGSFIARLHSVEKQAGVTRLPLRASHGLRRACVTEVYNRTQDIVAALEWVGDGVNQASRYVKGQDGRMARTAKALGTSTDHAGAAAATPSVETAAPAVS